MSTPYSIEVYNSLLQKTAQNHEEIAHLKMKKKLWDLEKKFLMDKLIDIESRPKPLRAIKPTEDLDLEIIPPPANHTSNLLSSSANRPSTSAIGTSLLSASLPSNPTITTLPSLSLTPLTLATLRDASDASGATSSNASGGTTPTGKPKKRRAKAPPDPDKPKKPKAPKKEKAPRQTNNAAVQDQQVQYHNMNPYAYHQQYYQQYYQPSQQQAPQLQFSQQLPLNSAPNMQQQPQTPPKALQHTSLQQQNNMQQSQLDAQRQYQYNQYLLQQQYMQQLHQNHQGPPQPGANQQMHGHS